MMNCNPLIKRVSYSIYLENSVKRPPTSYKTFTDSSYNLYKLCGINIRPTFLLTQQSTSKKFSLYDQLQPSRRDMTQFVLEDRRPIFQQEKVV